MSNPNNPFGWAESIYELLDNDDQHLPLLPCGAGDSGKAPLVSNWQHQSWEPLELIAEFNPPRLKAVGINMNPDFTGGLVAFDFDGSSAVERGVQFGCDPSQAKTWKIGRTTDQDRLKVVFRKPEPWPDLPGKTIIRTGDGEQIEVFWGSGQILAAGNHVSSGGEYIWLDGSKPRDVIDIPQEWMTLWMSGINAKPANSAGAFAHRRSREENGEWVDSVPCPICGRTEPDCRRSHDGKVILCHYGKRWSPPVMAKGETLQRGHDVWAYCGDKETAVGNAALFRIHEEQRDLRQKKVEAGQALRVMAEQLGEMPRLNIRTRGIHINGREATPTQTENLYLRLSVPPSPYRWSQKMARDAFIELANENEFDPVAVYLHNLKADKLPDEDWNHLSRFLFDIDDEIADQFMPRYLVGAVARVLTPGCQLRQTPVLQGGQGIGKTELGRALFGHDFYGDGLTPALDIDDVTKLQHVWGMELDELNGITRRTQVEKLKAFLSRRVDLVRRKYAPGTEPIQRRSTFWATTNKSPLSDNTGSSRFVMIPLGDDKLPVARVAAARDSIWARAYAEFRNGFQYWSTDEEMDAILARNSDFDLIDPWSDLLGEWLQRHGTAAYVSRDQIYSFLDIAPERQNNYNAQRIRELMANHGWKYDRRRINKKWVRAFWNPCRPE